MEAKIINHNRVSTDVWSVEESRPEALFHINEISMAYEIKSSNALDELVFLVIKIKSL